MTTAHRPTFDPARGKEAQRGPAYHQRLLPAHTHLKQRQAGQGGAADSDVAAAPRDLRAELLKAEASAKAKKEGKGKWDADEAAEEAVGEKRKAIADQDDAMGDTEEEDPAAKRRRLILEEAHDIDQDSAGSSDSDDSSSDDDEEDETAELMRELAKIKAERAAEKEREEAERAAKEAEEREYEIARGNPLLNGPQDYKAKTRWNDDTIFKNQARGTDEKGKRKEFVNDLLRSDFHKRFMSKYVR